jgi:hypothetical protein
MKVKFMEGERERLRVQSVTSQRFSLHRYGFRVAESGLHVLCKESAACVSSEIEYRAAVNGLTCAFW